MAVQTRPYFITINGVDRMVEATNPAGAVRHVVGAAVTELRPARGAEVAAWVRANRTIEIAGQKAAESSPGDTTNGAAQSGEVIAPAGESEAIVPEGETVVDETVPVFMPEDAKAWLATQICTKGARTEFDRVLGSGRMTLEQFDIIRTGCAAFADVLVEAVNGAGTGPAICTVDDLRAQFEDDPATLEFVVGAIGEAKRRELFVTGEAVPDA